MEEYRAAAEGAGGLTVVLERDTTEMTLRSIASLRAEGTAGGTPSSPPFPVDLSLVFGDDFGEIATNMMTNVEDGAVGTLLLVVEKQ